MYFTIQGFPGAAQAGISHLVPFRPSDQWLHHWGGNPRLFESDQGGVRRTGQALQWASQVDFRKHHKMRIQYCNIIIFYYYTPTVFYSSLFM